MKWSRVFHRSDCECQYNDKKILMCIALPQAKFSSYYFSILKYATEENKISWFVSKIKYVDIRIFLLLLQVNAWHGRTIAERDETQFDLQETHSLLTGAMHVILVAIYRRCYTIFVFDSIKHYIVQNTNIANKSCNNQLFVWVFPTCLLTWN